MRFCVSKLIFRRSVPVNRQWWYAYWMGCVEALDTRTMGILQIDRNNSVRFNVMVCLCRCWFDSWCDSCYNV